MPGKKGADTCIIEAGPDAGLRLFLGVSGYSHAHPRHLRLDPALGAPMQFPAGWALIEHPLHGPILFDCGYGAAARAAMGRGLRRVYRHVLGACCPAQADPSRLLAERGLRASDVRTVVLSHFHPDHVGGLREFPEARCVAHAEAWRQVCDGGWFDHLHAQIWRELLPADTDARLRKLDVQTQRPLPGALAAFGCGWDLFDDGSGIAFALPGHATGQLGLALTVAGERVLLVADAFSRREQLDALRPPPWWVHLLAIRDSRACLDTLQRLRRFRDDNLGAWIIPAHCAATLADWQRRHPGSVLGMVSADARC
ncbi:MAG: MBL fold metallo-hydrolase [Lysobacter sp.]|nr:MBL fold metallo-hydrolase [Lysobacter sp.]